MLTTVEIKNRPAFALLDVMTMRDHAIILIIMVEAKYIMTMRIPEPRE